MRWPRWLFKNKPVWSFLKANKNNFSPVTYFFLFFHLGKFGRFQCRRIKKSWQSKFTPRVKITRSRFHQKLAHLGLHLAIIWGLTKIFQLLCYESSKRSSENTQHWVSFQSLENQERIFLKFFPHLRFIPPTIERAKPIVCLALEQIQNESALTKPSVLVIRPWWIRQVSML